jgi:signal transduction histidine kinase
MSVLRRTARAAAWQCALALGMVLLLVGVVLYGLNAHIQDREIDAQLTQVAARVDDVDDPPPGMLIAIRDQNGTIPVSSPAPALTSTVLTGSTGYRDVRSGGKEYRALVADRPGMTIAVLVDLSPWHQNRQRLLMALFAAETAGLAAAVGVAVLLSRRTIRPMVAALALQRRFVADASHELRAPLTVLHTRAQLLARRAESHDLDQALRTQLGGLVADTRALADIVDDLLLAASAQHEPDRIERVDVLQLCHEVRESVTAHSDSRDITIDVVAEVAAGQAVVAGTRPALRRAIFALVDNALNHERPSGTVTMRVTRTGRQVEVTVTDTGVGLDPRDAERLFRRFAHGDGHSAGTRAHGIGLALVREVVETHRGRITVVGAPGRGAAFTLHLPAARS